VMVNRVVTGACQEAMFVNGKPEDAGRMSMNACRVLYETQSLVVLVP
jgi:hypothetical protein